MSKALYFHGFLGTPDDMKPLFIEGYDCISIDVRAIQDDLSSFFDLYNERYKFAVGYSFGGRVLAKILNINPELVDKAVFCSSRITGYNQEELEKREAFKKTIIEKLDNSYEDFNRYWRSLPLFGASDLSSYRKANALAYMEWTEDEIRHYLDKHFTYSEPDRSGFQNKSWFFYGEKDKKYKDEAPKLSMNSFEFKNCGHRFLFEDPRQFKEVLQKEVLK